MIPLSMSWVSLLCWHCERLAFSLWLMEPWIKWIVQWLWKGCGQGYSWATGGTFLTACVCVCVRVVNRGLKTKQYVQASTNRNYSVSMVYSRKMLIQTNVALKLICNFHHWWCFQVQAVSSSCQALIYPHNIKDASFDLSIEPLWSFWSLVWKMKCSCFPKKEF